MEQKFNFNNELSGKIALVTERTKGAVYLAGTEYIIDGETIPST